MFYRSYFLLTLLTILFISCKTYEADKLPATQLLFGTGGGYAGTHQDYVLLENGQIFEQVVGKEEWKFLKKVNKGIARQMYQRWEKNGMDEIQFNYPGNIYYYIGMRTADNENKISWGDGKLPVDNALKELYQDLSALVQN